MVDAMTESINKNYYVALYQAILSKDPVKTAKLDELSDKEQEYYPNEFPKLDYEVIFADNDPENFIKELIKSDVIFYKEYIASKKEIFKHYLIASYQYASVSSVEGIKKLIDMTLEEKINYTNEFPELDYDQIFADNNPDDILDEFLITEDGELELLAYDLLNPLASDETIAKRKESFEEINQYPLIKYCPNPYLDQAIIESIASKTYSKIFNYSEFKFSLEQLISKSDILSECITAAALDVNDSLTIVLVGEEMTDFDPTTPSNNGGYFLISANQIVVTNAGERTSSQLIAHEFAHKLMNLLFNDGANPYPKDDVEIKIKYHKAIKEVLLNIKELIQNDFGIDIKLKEDETTWDIGKKLAAILAPERISNDEALIKYLVDILQENNLNINQPITLLGSSYLEEVVFSLQFETADLMIKNGFELNHNMLVTAVALGYKQVIDWYLNQNDIDLNFRNQFGNTALDWSMDTETTKLLISAGAEVYSPRYFELICSINKNFIKVEKLSPLLSKNLEAITKLLALYLHSSYNENEEDREFIVMLPQVMAAELYEGKIVDILAPMKDYWEDVISPKFQEFETTHDESNLCLPLSGATSYFID